MNKFSKIVLSTICVATIGLAAAACNQGPPPVETYNVTITGATGSGVYEDGAEVSVTAQTVAGKRFVKWTDGTGTELSTDTTYTFVVSADTEVIAVYVNTYTVTVTGGEGSGTYDEGASVTATATVESGKKFVKWVDKDGTEVSTDATYTFTASANVELTAVCINTYSVTVTNGEGSGTYDEGATVTVTAPTQAGQRFVKWVVAGEQVSTDATYTFTASANVELLAVYVNTYTVAVTGGEGSGTYDEGATVTVTATVESGKKFVKWVDKDGAQVSTDATYTFTASANVELTAVCVDTYSVTVTGGEGSGTYAEGETAVITATVPYNKAFVKWIDKDGNDVSTEASYSFTVSGAVEYTAVLEDLEWVTKKYNENEDFADGSAQFGYEGGAFKIANSGLITATTKESYGVMEMSYVISGMDYYGDAGSNFAIIFNNGWIVKYMRYYGWIALFPAGVSSGVDSINVDASKTYKVRVTVTEDKTALYVSTYDSTTETFGEETKVSEFDSVVSASAVTISSYNSSLTMKDFQISYWGKPIVGEEKTVTVTGGEGSGTYVEGETAVITATVPYNKAFVKWIDKDGNEVSTDARYSFEVVKNVEYTAVLEDLEWVTKKYTVNEDFADGSAQFGYEGGAFKIADSGVITATTKESYGVMEMSYVISGMDYYGDAGSNFAIIFNNGWVVKYSRMYGWIALFPAGVSSGVDSISVDASKTYKVRVTVTEDKTALYVSTYDSTTETFGEETKVSEFDSVVSASAVMISSYNSSLTMKDFQISYWGKPVVEEDKELTE